MGNQASQPSSDFHKQFYQLQQQVKNQQQRQNVDLSRLQNQLHFTQMKLQEMKQNQHSQQQRPQQPPQYNQQQRTQQPPQYNQQQRPQQAPQYNQYQQRPPQQPQQPPQQPPQYNQQQQAIILQNNNKMNSLLNSPELKQEMANNPAFGVQIIELILKEFGTQLSDTQYEKIND